MSSAPILPIQSLQAETASLNPPPFASLFPAGRASFAQVLMDGIENVNEKLVDADAMVKAFTLDDAIPVHQVTFALEQARLSLELMMQVRSHLLQGYQQFMNMQL